MGFNQLRQNRQLTQDVNGPASNKSECNFIEILQQELNSATMSEYIFNDIYGNEGARSRYEHHRQFSYFNTILKLHNKYYEDNKMHGYIFSPRKPTPKLTPLACKKQQKYVYYSVQKVNNLTFRINRKNVANNQMAVTISELVHADRDHDCKTNRNREQSRELNRSIIRDAEFLKSTLEARKKDRKLGRYDREDGEVARVTKQNAQIVSKELYNFVDLAQAHLS